MIDVRTIDARRDGDCYECGALSGSDDIAEFRLGTFRVRLCPEHAAMLERSLKIWCDKRRSL